MLEVAVVLLLIAATGLWSQRIGDATPAGAFVGWAGIMGAAACAIWLQRRRGGSLRDFGLGRPQRWGRTVLLAVAAGAFVLIVGGLLLQVLIAGLGLTPPDASRFRDILSTGAGLALGLLSVWTSAAFGEEIVMRGFALSRLAAAFGGGRGAWILSLVVGSAAFGALHAYQGASGMLVTGVAGLLLGTAFLIVRRNLWVVVIAHGLVDTLSFVSMFLALRGGHGG